MRPCGHQNIRPGEAMLDPCVDGRRPEKKRHTQATSTCILGCYWLVVGPKIEVLQVLWDGEAMLAAIRHIWYVYIYMCLV